MEEKNKNNLYKSIMIIIITALVTCIITTIVIYNYFMLKIGISRKSNGIESLLNNVVSSLTGTEVTESIDYQISQIKKKLDEIYIGEIDEKKLIEGALKGYVEGVGDEYTEYLSEDDITALRENINGSYVGVGVYIANISSTNEIIVAGVIDDSPASKAGILPGDIIRKVDDEEFKGEQLTQASNNMKGAEGTHVKVTVERDEKLLDFDIIREKIKFTYVKSEKLDNNIGYIKISSFEGKCSEEFKKEYEKLKSQGIKSLIIDLRNNGGGLVDQSLNIAEMIVPKDSKILIAKNKDKEEEVTISKKNPIVDVPVVILVNGYTASASEILTAAVRENTDAKVVGTQTYGKGVIQGIYLFNDDKTGLKITMQEYFTPNHNKLNKIGITPDVVVELDGGDYKSSIGIDKKDDLQLSKAMELLK